MRTLKRLLGSTSPTGRCSQEQREKHGHPHLKWRSLKDRRSLIADLYLDQRGLFLPNKHVTPWGEATHHHLRGCHSTALLQLPHHGCWCCTSSCIQVSGNSSLPCSTPASHLLFFRGTYPGSEPKGQPKRAARLQLPDHRGKVPCKIFLARLSLSERRRNLEDSSGWCPQVTTTPCVPDSGLFIKPCSQGCC